MISFLPTITLRHIPELDSSGLNKKSVPGYSGGTATESKMTFATVFTVFPFHLLQRDNPESRSKHLNRLANLPRLCPQSIRTFGRISATAFSTSPTSH